MSRLLTKLLQRTRCQAQQENAHPPGGIHPGMSSTELGHILSERKEAARIDRINAGRRKKEFFIKTSVIGVFVLLCICLIRYNRPSQGSLKGNEARRIADKIEWTVRKQTNTDPSEMILPDGSQVWLSRGSRFMYATDFSKKRETYLYGRASFDVKPDKDRPFILHAGHTTIQMLGTRFDVTSDNDGRKSKIRLINGSIRVIHGNIQVLLHPGEQASMNEEGMTIWKRGRLERSLLWNEPGPDIEFDSVALDEVLRQMATWYQVKVVNPDHIRGNPITGVFKQKDPLKKNLVLLQHVERWVVRLERRNDTIFLIKPKS